MDVTMLPSSHEASSRRNPLRQISVVKSILDAEDVTRAALLGGAENWFDVRWYREVPEARQGRLREAARLLWHRIAETRLRRMAWRIDLRKVFAITAENPAP